MPPLQPRAVPASALSPGYPSNKGGGGGVSLGQARDKAPHVGDNQQVALSGGDAEGSLPRGTRAGQAKATVEGRAPLTPASRGLQPQAGWRRDPAACIWTSLARLPVCSPAVSGAGVILPPDAALETSPGAKASDGPRSLPRAQGSALCSQCRGKAPQRAVASSQHHHDPKTE